jgi:hypothetical protein
MECFSILFHFLINLSNLLDIGHWTHQPKGYQHSLNIRSEGASQKRQKKRMSDSFFKNFEKITLYLSLVPAPYLPHF